MKNKGKEMFSVEGNCKGKSRIRGERRVAKLAYG